eukprot:gene2571-3102_t
MKPVVNGGGRCFDVDGRDAAISMQGEGCGVGGQCVNGECVCMLDYGGPRCLSSRGGYVDLLDRDHDTTVDANAVEDNVEDAIEGGMQTGVHVGSTKAKDKSGADYEADPVLGGHAGQSHDLASSPLFPYVSVLGLLLVCLIAVAVGYQKALVTPAPTQ